MINLNHLRTLNPSLKIYTVHDSEFSEYGRVLTGLPTEELLTATRAIVNPVEGSKYEASVAAFEQTPFAASTCRRLFGELPAEIGYCWGHNSCMNAMEWHTSSEINVAVTPLVLILGRRADLKNDYVNSDTFRAFYVEAGETIEVYATSLHFCPCEVSANGFGCVVGLPKGTNLPLETPAMDPLLFRKNKWLIAHEENAGLIARGGKAGICGENYKLSY